MVVVMQERATDEQVQRVIAQLVEMGFDVHRSTGALRTVLGAVGGRRQRDRGSSKCSTASRKSLRITEPYKLASRTFKPENTRDLRRRRADWRRRSDRHGRSLLGGERSSRSRRPPRRCKRAGAKVLRGGAFKPRSSPYSFQGLGEEGLRMLRIAADRHNLKLVSEVMDISQLELIEQVRRHPAGRRAQHAELTRCCASSVTHERRCCSSAASRRRSRSGCSRRSTSSPAATWT